LKKLKSNIKTLLLWSHDSQRSRWERLENTPVCRSTPMRARGIPMGQAQRFHEDFSSGFMNLRGLVAYHT